MASLTDTGENRSLDWLTGNATTAPTLPLMVRLMTTNGTDAAAGTEATGSGYAPKQGTFAAASGGSTSNTAAVDFGVLDATASRTITGFEVWDSAATPVRWWHAPLSGGDKTIAAGETCSFAAGALTLTQA